MVVDIISKYMVPVMKEVERRWRIINKLTGGFLSTKLKSEIISCLFGSVYHDTVPNARQGNGDHDADVYIHDIPLELKTTHDSREWRGGDYSKRMGDFMLISWKDDGDKLALFAVHTKLEKEDWKSSKSERYYATSINIDDLLQKDIEVLVGGIKKKIKLHHPVFEVIQDTQDTHK